MCAELTWYGQSAFMITTKTCSVLIDPYFSNSIDSQGFIRSYDSPVKKGELKVNYVISSHNHGDHMDVETLRDYITFDKFYGPKSCTEALGAAGFASDKIVTFDRGDTVSLGDVKCTAVYAEHTPDSIGVVAECGGTKLYFTGDSLMSRKLREIKDLSPDVLLTCINGKFGNMTWQEAVIFAHTLGVKTAIPAHYDLFAINRENPALFAEAFERSPINAKILERCKAYDIQSLLN